MPCFQLDEITHALLYSLRYANHGFGRVYSQKDSHNIDMELGIDLYKNK